MKRILIIAVLASVMAQGATWPVLRTYEGEALRRVKMPLGGIGTGTISLSGRGGLVDWEIYNRPAKGFIPHGLGAPHFAIRVAEEGNVNPMARLLEGPLLPEEYEGDEGCAAPNHGFPRFRKAVFKAAYPFAQVELSDTRFPLTPRLEAFNPLVPGDAEASGIPAILFRWQVKNTTPKTQQVSIAIALRAETGVTCFIPEGTGDVTEATDIRSPGWNVALDRYWRTFLEKGIVADTSKDDSTAKNVVPAHLKAVTFSLKPGEAKAVPFILAWHQPRRMAWDRYDSTNAADVVGNWYTVKYPNAEAAAKDLWTRLPTLEAKTLAFVREILARPVPAVIREAALFNLTTFRTETCFRTADGHFYGWEGCRDRRGSCYGSCTHVWGYEHALIDLWPELARDMVETQFSVCLDERGHMVFRCGLPRTSARSSHSVAAADGQMQCIVKAYEVWKKTAGDAWLQQWWPQIRKAMAFCWVEGGWDADCDGLMEGCQHNTMDVEYYGPNPQMGFLYLAALQAAERMATACHDAAFAETCRTLREKGRVKIEAELFNGAYYEHKIVPPKGPIAKGLQAGSGARDLSNPDYQLGAGCLIDQLLGDFAARAAGLEPVADVAHARITLKTILVRCRKEADDTRFNCMRDYALMGERSLRMAWYPEGRMPRSPFPYYRETMTGFEYVVAALLAMHGEYDAAEQVVRDIRDRYDGVKRNPFDEAECGHHYARALVAWTVLKAWK